MKKLITTVFLLLTSTANAAGVDGLFVEDSTIYWNPDGNWTQVQLAVYPYTEICSGRDIALCVVPSCKIYNVVVPESGTRSENVTVPCPQPFITYSSEPIPPKLTSSNSVQVCSITSGNTFSCSVSCPNEKVVSGSHCGATANGLIRPSSSQTNSAGRLTCSTNGPAPVTIRAEASCY